MADSFNFGVVPSGSLEVVIPNYKYNGPEGKPATMTFDKLPSAFYFHFFYGSTRVSIDDATLISGYINIKGNLIYHLQLIGYGGNLNWWMEVTNEEPYTGLNNYDMGVSVSGNSVTFTPAGNAIDCPDSSKFFLRCFCVF